MFKGMTLHLERPICSCKEECLTWQTTLIGSLIVKCERCKSELRVPHKFFKADIVFDDPYPRKRRHLRLV